ncbi:iron complex outermembrane receptor protein [Mucilaginibacter sp. SG538B]|uniref:TonB-dependent receptor n=1 Tax=Mucilaginibacter sp. SG538B TaxID=2587021 RepID=UPI00159D836A|nr:TonB-dependent receptor [Mucilaginibacter sp. SG538B]NVM64610.1 iron complex outermembrane receptor protein [Mucilaginibacter sp. SG538B]
MKLKLISFIILLLVQVSAFADVVIVKGRVVDAQSKQTLPGAVITIPELKISAITDPNGEFSFKSLPNRGRFLFSIEYVGYKSLTKIVDLSAGTPLVFELQSSIIETHEVVITGTAISANNKQNSTSVSAVGRDGLLRQSTNLIDALAHQVPGMSQITTGPSISKPVIRGLSYNRVVTLSDGVKQQGQQWGDEHGIEIDQYSSDRVEVLRGAASLLYGSDALGGVINLLEPLTPPDGQIKGEFLTNYSTNNGLTGTSLMLTGNENGLVWRARGSYKNAYSFKTPDYYFPNSGFNETDLSGMIGLNKSWGYSHINLSYFKNNIGFYDPEPANGLNFLHDDGTPFTQDEYKSRTLEYPKQDIRHYKINWDNNFITEGGNLKVNLGYQKNQRRELDGPDPSLFFDLNTYSGDVKYYVTEANGWQPVFGASSDIGHSLNKGSEFLIPAYDTYGVGAFAYIKKTWDKNTFNAGVRYDYRKNEGKGLVEDGETKFTPFTNKFSNISGALGYTHEFNENLNFKANAGSAFRAPNPAELGSNGVHEGTFRYEIGNPNLAPERSYQVDATLQYDDKIVSASLGIYENYIHNYIYASHKQGDVAEAPNESGSLSQFDVYRYNQVNANLYGVEGNFTLHPVSFIHFENTFGYTYARNNTLDRPLAFIPAGTLKNTLRFEPTIKGLKQSYISVGIDNFFNQYRYDSAFETGTKGYTLLNAGLGTTVNFGKQPVKLYVSGNNLANIKYYDALSRLKPGRISSEDPEFGIYNMGRNITFGIYLPLSIN